MRQDVRDVLSHQMAGGIQSGETQPPPQTRAEAWPRSSCRVDPLRRRKEGGTGQQPPDRLHEPRMSP